MKSKLSDRIVTHDLGVDPNFWVTPMGDMMTFLMIFFLILWAYTQFIKKQDLRKMPQPIEEKQRVLIKELQNIADVKVTKRKMQIKLPEAVLFASGKATLKPSRTTLPIKFFKESQRWRRPHQRLSPNAKIPLQSHQ